MFHKRLLTFIAVLAAVSLLLTACGSKEDKKNDDAPASSSGTEVLSLTEWALSTSTWSSPNGATVHLVANPAGYVKGQTASFVIRLDGEDVETVPCEWDGQHYTASADLNAENGYCYYVLLTGSNGETAEVAVNIPSSPVDESLINLGSSLESSCSLVAGASSYDGSWLTITSGTITVNPPRITNEGTPITCTKVQLTLNLEDQPVSQAELEIPSPNADGSYTISLTDTSLQTPAMEDDQRLFLQMEATLSNGQVLTAAGGNWFYNAGDVMMSVG